MRPPTITCANGKPPPVELPSRALAMSPLEASAPPPMRRPPLPSWYLSSWSEAEALMLFRSTFSTPDTLTEIDEVVYVPPRLPRPGVGSNGSQPYPLNQTSTQVCALRSLTAQLWCAAS